MVTRIATLAPFCLLPVVVLVIAWLSATQMHAPWYGGGGLHKTIPNTCAYRSPFMDNACWNACHSSERTGL